jgi:hypothetical protein
LLLASDTRALGVAGAEAKTQLHERSLGKFKLGVHGKGW